MLSQSPTYNLKAVLRETGLKADVLRAWERRYGLPKPERTEGGHRLYSEYDIATVNWLKARNAEGLSISHAVKLWNDILEAGRDPLMEYLPSGTPPISVSLPVGDTRVETLRQKWSEANLAFDSLRADDILNQAFAIYPIETVCTEIIQEGIRDIGSYWYLDQASVQQEHFASELATRRLETLLAATPRPTRSQTVLIGCPPGEQHTLPVLQISLFLARRGLRVIYLGADIPLDRLGETAATIQPDLIVLAAQQLTTATSLRATALALQGSGYLLAYGGLIFNRAPRLRALIPAHFLGETIAGALPNVERLVIARTPAPPGIDLPETHQALARLYRDKRPLIDLAVAGKLQANHVPGKYIRDANSFFGNGLAAALEFGDPAFLEADLEWVKKLLTGRNITEETLIRYLSAYSDILRDELGMVSTPITNWIAYYAAQSQMNHR